MPLYKLKFNSLHEKCFQLVFKTIKILGDIQQKKNLISSMEDSAVLNTDSETSCNLEN